MNPQFPAQEAFMKYIRSWFESLEIVTSDMSCVHESQCDLILQQAIADQE
jgi:hypothetical protein